MHNLDSTPRSRKIGKILAKLFQSFISAQIIPAAPIGFLFLKALYLSFQMHTSLGRELAPPRWRGPGCAGPFKYRLISKLKLH